MNPTGKNVASYDGWKGLKAPWIGTKNIWNLFYNLNLLDGKIFIPKLNYLKGKNGQKSLRKKYMIM